MACSTENDYLPKRYNFPSAVAGNTYPGTGLVTIKVNGSSPTNALSAVVITFTENDSLSANLVLSSNTGTVTIINAASWSFSIPEQKFNLSKGIYNHKIETYSVTGQLRTYIVGTLKLV